MWMNRFDHSVWKFPHFLKSFLTFHSCVYSFSLHWREGFILMLENFIFRKRSILSNILSVLFVISQIAARTDIDR